jgi:hypothetical protein
VVSYSFFIDRGRARDNHVTVNGKRKTVIVYIANLVTRRAGRQHLSFNGVSAGTHKLRLVILLRSTEQKPRRSRSPSNSPSADASDRLAASRHRDTPRPLARQGTPPAAASPAAAIRSETSTP